MKKRTASKIFLFPRLRANLLALLAAILLLGINLVGFLPGVTTPLENFELASSDQLFRLRGKQPPNVPVMMVAIDDFSFSWNSLQWPWPRITWPIS